MSASPASVACGPKTPAGVLSDEVAARRESDLIERAKHGDLDAYELLVREYQRLAYRMARALTRDAADAEDATQEAFLKAYRSLGRFRRGAPFKPWLLKIVTNEAHSRIRSRTRAAAIAGRAIANAGRRTPEQPTDSVVVRTEERQQLAAALDRLPQRLRDAVTCRYLLELSENETAAALGIRPGTVKSRLSRALERLERELSAA